MPSQPRLAARVTGLKPSATVEMTERVRAARASGRRIIGLSSGDPGVPTDPRIVEAALRAPVSYTHLTLPTIYSV